MLRSQCKLLTESAHNVPFMIYILILIIRYYTKVNTYESERAITLGGLCELMEVYVSDCGTYKNEFDV